MIMNLKRRIMFFCLLYYFFAYGLNCSSVVSATVENNVNYPRTYFDILNDTFSKRKISRNTRTPNVDVINSLNFFRIIEGNVFKNLDDQIDDNTRGNRTLKNRRIIDALHALGNTVEDGKVLPICANDTGRLIVSLLEGAPWAMQFFDATGKPGPTVTKGWVNFVGNYHQCRSAVAPGLFVNGTVAYKGNYCKIGLKPYALPIHIELGACVPDTCSEEELTHMIREVINITNSSLVSLPVQCVTGETEVTAATIIAIIVISVLGTMMILGTLFDIAYVQMPMWQKERISQNSVVAQEEQSSISGERNRKLETTLSSDVERSHVPSTNNLHDDHFNTVWSQILLGFSVYTNIKKTLNVTQRSGSLTSIHGIRFLSMSWVVLAHVFYFAPNYAQNYATDFPTLLHRWSFTVIGNGFVSVDTFFALSGLLTSYLTAGEIMRKKRKLNWVLFYFHRYWRLTPPYLFTLVVYVGLQQYFIEGALRSSPQPTDKAACEKNWWTNVLYINNIVRSDEVCFGHTWYLACDMQFFIISPLIFIPFVFHRLAGVCSCLLFLVIIWITTGVLSNVGQWTPTGLSLDPTVEAEGRAGWLDNYYGKPWCRIGPFVVGILAGCILAVTKGKPFHMKWWTVVLGWLVAIASGIAVVYGIHGDITGEHLSSVGASAFYNAVARSVWGACVCWVIIACSAGYGGPVNALLSWSPFVVLGRLTYMVYLIHIPIIYIFYENLEQPLYINDTTMVTFYLGILVASHLVAFVFMLGFESPMIGLERALLKKKKM